MAVINGDTMQTLRAIKKRTAAVKGTMKIVSAMKMIAASKLKKVQDRVIGIRPMEDEIKNLALQVAMKDGYIAHPAFTLRKETKKSLVLVITPHRGFCGALPENMCKQIRNYLSLMEDRKVETEVLVLGNRGARTFKKHGIKIKKLNLTHGDFVDELQISELCTDLLDKFLTEKYDQVVLAYNYFLSAVSNQVILDMFLPIWVKKIERPELDDKVDFIYEPNKDQITEWIIKERLKIQFIRAIYESRASELAARMVSMEEAFKNAKDMVNNLNREHNRIRQASITKDLMDIVGGAEALKKM